MNAPLLARWRRYCASYRWIEPVCIVGVIINLSSGIHDLVAPTGWWSYLFGALSFACAGVCVWAWRGHRRLATAHGDLS